MNLKHGFLQIIASISNQFSRLKSIRPQSGRFPLVRAAIVVLRRHWVLGVAMLTAVAAFLMTQQYASSKVRQERERLLPRGGLVEVLVAARDLSAGDVVSPLTVAVRRIPQDWSLPTSITPLDFDAIHQRPLVKPLKGGHPITTDHLRQSLGVVDSFRLEAGFRAISIAVDEVSSVGGLIQPGDRIDLWSSPAAVTNPTDGAIISLSAERSPMQPQARLIAENLLVVATGSKTERAGDSALTATRGAAIGNSYSTITLAVPAGVANLVLGGQLQGRVGIALRAAEQASNAVARKSTLDSRAGGARGGPVEILIGSTEGATR
ncbi:MAG: Flp pilus assembly protein CpaB [Burkholderiaceae bacterium]|nr:Flp pilus assembly protein CpaB [Burkholderiaceae bacterium]